LLTPANWTLHHTSSPFPSDALGAEYDVISGISSIVGSLPFKLHWEHVKGHQDEVLPLDQLAHMEKLNILANSQASIRIEYAVAACTVDFITPSIVELRVNATTITSHYATHLRQAAGSQDFFLWYSTNYKWTSVMINFVDWDTHLAATGKLSFSEKQFNAKFNFQWLPTGHQQHKVDPAQSTICPSCRNPEVEETKTYLYQCPRLLPLVGGLFNKLQKFHEQEHTCPTLQDTLFTALKHEIFKHPPSFFNHHENEEVT
jgi:hypothetical protein